MINSVNNQSQVQSHQHKFQNHFPGSDIDVGYNSSGGLTPPHQGSHYDFGFIPGSPLGISCGQSSFNKTVSSDTERSSLSLHDVALEAELAMLQHAYANEDMAPPRNSTGSSSPSVSSSIPENSGFDLSNNSYQQHHHHQQQQQHHQQKQWNIMEQHFAWRNTLATANLMNLQSQVHTVMGHGAENHSSQTQAALGLLYDYYQHQNQQPMRKQHYHAHAPIQPAVQPVVPKQPVTQPVVSVKSEPVDHSFESSKIHANKAENILSKPENLTVLTPTDIKKEAHAPNSGLPENYKGEYFEYSMEAPRSLKQKEGEPTMSYINKGNCLFFLFFVPFFVPFFLPKLWGSYGFMLRHWAV